MSRAAKSVLVFAVYLFALGAVLLLAPNTLLSLFGMPEVQDVWIRVVGVLVLLLGYYYSGAARAEFTPFLRWTVYARGSVMVFFSLFVLAGLAPRTLLLFGAIDLVAAIWTHRSLEADRAATAVA